MKHYSVLMTSTAEAEIEAAYNYIFADSPTHAARWRQGLLRAVDSLETMPERCGLSVESGAFDFEVRQFNHGNYRLLFTISGDEVHVLHVRHAAQRPLNE